MDDIAAAAGLGRRTVFRHFESRERLVADALEAGITRYGEQLPPYADPWESWLTDLCDAAHRMQADYGPGYWELISRTDLPPEVAAVEVRRRVRRRDAMARIAGKLWSASGGAGDAPPLVLACVGAHLNPRFTAAVTLDVGGTWEQASALAQAAILQVLTAVEMSQTATVWERRLP